MKLAQSGCDRCILQARSAVVSGASSRRGQGQPLKLQVKERGRHQLLVKVCDRGRLHSLGSAHPKIMCLRLGRRVCSTRSGAWPPP